MDKYGQMASSAAMETGYVLGAVKTSNATHGHHGEMAWHQKLGFSLPRYPPQKKKLFDFDVFGHVFVCFKHGRAVTQMK